MDWLTGEVGTVFPESAISLAYLDIELKEEELDKFRIIGVIRAKIRLLYMIVNIILDIVITGGVNLRSNFSPGV